MSEASSEPASLREVEVLPLPPAFAQHRLKAAFELQEEEDVSEASSLPLGRICLTAALLFVGVGLLFFGVLAELRSPVPGKGVPYWVLGVLFLIPGGFCTAEIVRLWKSNFRMARIPEDAEI